MRLTAFKEGERVKSYPLFSEEEVVSREMLPLDLSGRGAVFQRTRLHSFEEWYLEGWQDHRTIAPDALIDAIEAVNAFMQLQENRAKPFICHCSGGVGRTGVFLVVREAMRSIDVGEEPDLYKSILHMRLYRNGSPPGEGADFVQNAGQLKLCYQALDRYRERKAVST